MCEHDLGSIAQGCDALALARSTFYRGSNVGKSTLRMEQQIMELSRKHPRYGYRKPRKVVGESPKTEVKTRERIVETRFLRNLFLPTHQAFADVRQHDSLTHFELEQNK